ncbi:hypothetical protein Bca52824_037381 [Brassica carinata]|uniref:Katanin p80 subunit C-terminal domain-containing protein n=1 Tax=Brassica carinata TaxID=52824 RepID=A0A8X7SBE4_BRACI|nr:hypothetical protein Bca52824_037381 [Brassica carinata]
MDHGTSSARVRPMSLSQAATMTSHECPITSTRPDRTSPARVMDTKLNQMDDMSLDTSHITSRHRASPSQTMVATTVTDEVANMAQDEANVSETDSDITENLMQTHEEFLSTLQSRLTKLQIVSHFWERSDVKGAIGALRKLTDQSVQADVISILTDKIEILTLDMFSQLVPVLTSLLGSRTERPVNVSLDMLLKLVAVFGTVIRSTVSAPRIVGVDLHADERTSSARVRPMSLSQAATMTSHECPITSTRPDRTSPARVMDTKLNQMDDMSLDTSHITSRHRASPSQTMVATTVTDEVANMAQDEANVSETDSDITENLMQTHEEFLSTLQSRLTKLQIVSHFWERSDVKGAIGALRKLTDQSVQADVISILTDKIEILTLDMPVNVSLDMLLKLVAVFGTVIRSTVSAPRIVVDLHADERIQICQVCSLGTAQDSKDSSNFGKKRWSNNKKGSRTKPRSSRTIATSKTNNDHGAAVQVLVFNKPYIC